MSGISTYLRSSIGKKKLVGLSGLGIVGFTLTHMSGNLLLFVGPDAYNKYSHALVSNPLINVAEAGLIGIFVLHIALTIQLTMANRAARPVGYGVGASGPKRTSFAAKSAILSGLLLLAFVVLHLWTFKYGEYYSTMVDGVEMRDIYRLVFEKFHEPLYVGWYLLCLMLLGMHLSHGVSASFQSLGVFASNHPVLKKIGLAAAFLIAGGFVAQPLYIFLGFGG